MQASKYFKKGNRNTELHAYIYRYTYIYTLQYILHTTPTCIYIGKYSIQNLCVFFRTSLGCRCLKMKTNPINSNQILMHTIQAYIVYIYMYIYCICLDLCTLGKNNGLVIDKKRNMKENKLKWFTQSWEKG